MSEKKIVSIEERIPKLKQARKKKANRRLIFYLSIFFVLISIVVYLQSPLSDVKQIEVLGNKYLDDEEIKLLSGLSKDHNIWGVDKSEIVDKVTAHPEIAEVEVVRRFPSTVKINVEEFVRVGYVKQSGSFFPVLETGKSLTSYQLKNAKGDAPLLLDFDKQTYLKEMTEELSELPQSIVDLISEIHWSPSDENPYRIKLYMNDGFEVEGSIRSFSKKMAAYPSIAAQLDKSDKGVIHIGVGAYFEPYKQETSSDETPEKEESQNETEG